MRRFCERMIRLCFAGRNGLPLEVGQATYDFEVCI